MESAKPRIHPIERKIVIFGGRDFSDYHRMEQDFLTLAENVGDEVGLSIVSGMARGADAVAVQIARKHHVKLYEFPADWDTHGRGAGFIRNRQMAEFADEGIGYWDQRSRGTRGMILDMQKLNKPLTVLHY